MILGPSKPNRVAGTLQFVAVLALSISQLIACLKLISPNSLLGLGAQALSLAGIYVGTRWSVEQLLEAFPELLTTPQFRPLFRLRPLYLQLLL